MIWYPVFSLSLYFHQAMQAFHARLSNDNVVWILCSAAVAFMLLRILRMQ